MRLQSVAAFFILTTRIRICSPPSAARKMSNARCVVSSRARSQWMHLLIRWLHVCRTILRCSPGSVSGKHPQPPQSTRVIRLDDAAGRMQLWRGAAWSSCACRWGWRRRICHHPQPQAFSCYHLNLQLCGGVSRGLIHYKLVQQNVTGLAPHLNVFLMKIDVTTSRRFVQKVLWFVTSQLKSNQEVCYRGG